MNNNSNEKSIKELVKELANDPQAELYSIFAKVVSVDESERTCDVEPVDGSAELFNVRLQAITKGESGLVLVPKQGSYVLVSFISKIRAFVASTEQLDKVLLVVEDEISVKSKKINVECDEIVINNGTNGGMYIAPKTNVELNKLKARMTALEAVIIAFSGAQAGVAGGVPIFAPLIPALTALGAGVGALPPTGTFGAGLIDDKIKH